MTCLFVSFEIIMKVKSKPYILAINHHLLFFFFFYIYNITMLLPKLL